MKKNIISGLIVVLGLLLVLLLSTLGITKAKSLYNYSIEKFDLMRNIDMSQDEMVENYSYVVDYILGDNKNEEFELPSLEYSKDGAIHFEEVRNLFDIAKYAIVALIVILAILFSIYHRAYRNFKPIRNLGISLAIVPLAAALIVSTNFNFFFTTFHKIFFNNDKWLFDPLTDPIINILPEEFFALCGGLIILGCIIIGIIIWVGYSVISNFEKSSS